MTDVAGDPYDLVIIGAGPTGLFAAYYAGFRGLSMAVVDSLPERYRGFLEVDMSICTACQACERACPINVIAIEIEKDPANPRHFLTVWGVGYRFLTEGEP